MPLPSPSSAAIGHSSSRRSAISSASDSASGRAEVARRNARNYFYRSARIQGLNSKAVDQLPPELLACPRKRHVEQILLFHFGFGVSLQQLYDYCVARDLVPKHYHGSLTWHTDMVEAAVQEIGRLCGAKLYLSTILHIDYRWIIARYSNHTWHREVLRDRDELSAVDIIQRELGLPEPPKWYRQRVRSPCGCFLI